MKIGVMGAGAIGDYIGARVDRRRGGYLRPTGARVGVTIITAELREATSLATPRLGEIPLTRPLPASKVAWVLMTTHAVIPARFRNRARPTAYVLQGGAPRLAPGGGECEAR